MSAPKQLFASVSAIVCSGVLASCAMDGRKMTANKSQSQAVAPIEKLSYAEREFQVRQQKDGYIAAAKEFVASTQKGDLPAMLKLTSARTLRETGREGIVEIYTRQLMPKFRDTSVSWINEIEVTVTDEGDLGALVFGHTNNRAVEKFFPVYVTVVSENGQFAVAHMSREKPRKPNQPSEPTPTSVTPRADARVAPAAVVAVMRRL